MYETCTVIYIHIETNYKHVQCTQYETIMLLDNLEHCWIDPPAPLGALVASSRIVSPQNMQLCQIVDG